MVMTTFADRFSSSLDSRNRGRRTAHHRTSAMIGEILLTCRSGREELPAAPRVRAGRATSEAGTPRRSSGDDACTHLGRNSGQGKEGARRETSRKPAGGPADPREGDFVNTELRNRPTAGPARGPGGARRAGKQVPEEQHARAEAGRNGADAQPRNPHGLRVVGPAPGGSRARTAGGRTRGGPPRQRRAQVV